MIKIFTFFILLIISLNAQTNNKKFTPLENIRAVRLNEQIIIDGKLDESVWNSEIGVSHFGQREPNEFAEATEKTTVYFAYDDQALYLAARMFDSSPDSIVAHLGRRDSWTKNDRILFFIDPYYDKRSGFYFVLNASGTMADGVMYNDDWDDDSWDGVWEGKVNIDENGWTAEMKIPFSQLRFVKSEDYVWGINIKREIARKNESNYLSVQPLKESGFVSRFIDLVGINNISPSSSLEILPYITGKAEYLKHQPNDPFNSGSLYTPGIGADIKYALGSNLILNASVNPDFGQVEVDPAVVNLSDVESFFQEKRPFFIEGNSIFRFGQGGAVNYWNFNWSTPSLFYSRRIGRSPQGSLPSADFYEVPNGTRILGAAKISGKIGDGYDFGAISSITAREHAKLQLNGNRSEAEIEPLTYYGIFRTQKDFNNGKQGVGIITTYANRFFKDDRLKDQLNGNSFVAGLDGWTFLDDNKEWVFTGWAALSRIEGTENRMISIQRNSQHYFQRPDAKSYSVDSSATSLTGYAGRFYINKQKGNTFFNSALGIVNPKFDVNDMGFQSRADIINAHVGAGYMWTEPNSFFRRAESGGAVFINTDFDYNITGTGIYNFNWIQFANYYSLSINSGYNPETVNNRRTRGGPLTLNPASWNINFNGGTDSRKDIVFYLGGQIYNQGASSSKSLWMEFVLKPSSNINLTISPEYYINNENAMWVSSFGDAAATETFGRRYVFANLNQKTFVTGIRLNWTFSPELSLQMYVQPLFATGEYSNFKELAKTKSYDFNNYGENGSTITYANGEYTVNPASGGSQFTFANPNFNFKSLRGNAVLRWEYSAGSVVYLVWTQDRSDFENNGEFSIGKSLNRLIEAEADNIFLLKFTYWLDF